MKIFLVVVGTGILVMLSSILFYNVIRGAFNSNSNGSESMANDNPSNE